MTMVKFPARLVRFLRRHKKALVSVGFVVASLSFLVKDIFDSRLRRQADAIQTASTTFLIRDSAFDLYREIDEVDAHVVDGNNEILQRMLKSRTREKYAIDLETFLPRSTVRELRATQETWLELNNLGLLIHAVSPQNSHISEFNDLYKQFDTFRMEVFTPVTPIDTKQPKRVSKTSMPGGLPRYLKMSMIHDKLQMLAASVLDDARHDLEKKEHLLSALEALIVLLFYCGIGVAVIIRWAGVETVEANGE